MADVTPVGDADEPDDPICEVCGCRIEEPDQECPAQDDGRCWA